MRKIKKSRVFINDGTSGFEEENIDKPLKDDIKKDLTKFLSKISKKRETGGSKVKK